MNPTSENITFEQLFKSLQDDFNSKDRESILALLKKSNPTDEALLGAKLLLEDHNWDYRVLKASLESAEHRVGQTFKESKKANWGILKYAAVFVPVAGIISLWMLFSNSSLEKYYIKEEGLPNTMSVHKASQMDSLMQIYASENMESSFEFSEKIVARNPQNDTLNYYHAVIAYELEKYEIAEKYFHNVALNTSSVFYNDAAFRLGFALYNLDKKQESIKQFIKVKESSSNPYQEEAATILTNEF